MCLLVCFRVFQFVAVWKGNKTVLVRSKQLSVSFVSIYSMDIELIFVGDRLHAGINKCGVVDVPNVSDHDLAFCDFNT